MSRDVVDPPLPLGTGCSTGM